MGKLLTCHENAINMYNKLGVQPENQQPETNNDDLDYDDQGKPENPSIVEYHKPLYHVA
ncbi:hypothetical protein RDWZM_009844 [Blomia tropicalis]|uniref:Uncharacterized protein n=1 Tax=Blomia tropicalis TaxID=40697 RepID=A0A9Q0LXX3_BLOTA|nr:hypothetical protein RDWZM_009844 [Blomia tropicalis]